MLDQCRRVLQRFRRLRQRFAKGLVYPLIAQRCPSLPALDRFLGL